MHDLRLGWAVVLLGSALFARKAHAFTIETSVTRGCHEEVTADVLRRVREEAPQLAVPLPTTRDDRAMIDDLPFTLPNDLHDLAAATLILGVRDNDVKNLGAEALDQLASLSADPDNQKLHCLRRADQDEPNGSEAAVDECRDFIKENLLAALDGLDAEGLPDGTKRDQLEVTLAIRGQVSPSVPRFYLRAGRALHTIEDSFTHTFRNIKDPHSITVVLNWIDYANKTLEEDRDGPEHRQELDRCDDPDALRTERRQLAIDAGTAAILLLLDTTTRDRAGKARAIDKMLDDYVSFDTKANCTFANHWCDAPEADFANSACGCRTPGAAPGRTATLSVAAGLLGLLVWARRRRVAPRASASTAKFRHVRRSVSVLGLVVAFGLCGAPRPALAETPARPANSDENSGPLKALAGKSNSGAPNTVDTAGAFFGRVAVGASYDKPGFAGGAGVRYQLSKPFMLGFDAEINPFITQNPSRVRTGVLNTYVSLIRRFQLKNDSLNVRSQVGLGASFLLIDLVGAPAGSFGPFFGLSFLGVEWKMARGFYLTIDPTYIAFPVPHLTGVPFGYLQYRFLVGLEFGG